MEYIRRALKLYPEEIVKTLRFALLSFLWSFTASGMVTFFDGVFLEVIGSTYLPNAYSCVAISLMVVSALLFKGLRSISLKKLFITVLLTTIVFAHIGMALLSLVSSHAFYWIFGLKVLSTVSYAALSITFWSFIDQYYDLQDAKRIYTLVMAAIFLGAIASGFFISKAAALFGIHGMTLTFCLSLGCAGVLTARISNSEAPVHDELEELPGAKSYSLSSWARQITGSAFALFLIANNILAQLLWNVSEFNYLSNFSVVFSMQPTYELTEFLGRVKAFISLGNVFFMLFIYSRLIHRIGLNRAVVLPYLLFLALYIVWAAAPSFTIAVLGIIAVEGALFTIEDNNFNLLLGIIPTNVKRSLRVFIEAFVEPLGILVASGLLTFESKAISIGLLLSIAAVLVAFALKSSYTWAIIANLRGKALNLTRKASERLKKLSKRDKRILIGRVCRGELPPLFSLQACLATENLNAASELLEHFSKFTEKEQQTLLAHLLSSPLTLKYPLIDACCRLAGRHTHPELQILLALNGKLQEKEAIKFIDMPDPRYQAAGILALERASDSKELEETYTKRSLATFALQRLLSSSDPEYLSQGLFAQGYMQHANDLKLLIPYLHHSARIVQIAAARSIERLLRPTDAPIASQLIEALKQTYTSDVRLLVIRSIEKALEPKLVIPLLNVSMRMRPIEKRAVIYALSSGRISADFLLKVTSNSDLDHRARQICGRALGKLAPKLLRREIREVIIPEIRRAQAYFWHAHFFKTSKEPHLKLLAECMQGSFCHLIDFVIGLLASAGSIEESELITHSLRSHNQKTHSHGVETLEKTCDRKIFRLLEPLVDDRPDDERVRRLPSFESDTLEDVLELLEKSPIVVDRLIAWHTRAKLKIGDWKKMALSARPSSEPLFGHFISELLQEEPSS